jgi:hypothetical protein
MVRLGILLGAVALALPSAGDGQVADKPVPKKVGRPF